MNEVSNKIRCLIPLKDGQVKVVNLSDRTLKVEKENAWAIAQGCHKPGGTYHVSIFTAGETAQSLKHDFDKESRYIPKIISYIKEKDPNYPSQ